MFKIVISLRFIDIINKPWHPLQTFGSDLKRFYLRNTNSDKCHTLLIRLSH